MEAIGTVQLTGNVARRHSRVPTMLTFPAQNLRVTAWIIATHASIFSCQQEHCSLLITAACTPL